MNPTSRFLNTFSNSPLMFILLAIALLSNTSCQHAEKIQQCDYPLFMSSAEKKLPYTEEELSKLATWFSHCNTSIGPDQVDRLKALNPDFVAMSSVNSSYCSSGNPDFYTFEKESRQGISMYKCATLPHAISASQSTFSLNAIPPDELDHLTSGIKVDGAETSGLSRGIRQSPRLSLRASTVEGSYSDKEKSTEKFVTWIQVGDEYMRIDAWDSISQTITVTRGFDGTEALSHPAGSNVLTPVYIGVLGHTWSGYFPGGFQHMLRYALRIDHPSVHRFKAMEVVKSIRENHLDGVWLDIMGYNFFNQSNMHGEQVIPWNFLKDAPYTSMDYMINQQRKAEGIRKYVEEELGRKVMLTANNFSNKYFPEQGGGQKLMQSTEVQPTPLDGLVLEGIGGEYLHDNFRTGESMLSILRQMIHMQEQGYRAFCSSDNNLVRRAETPEELMTKHHHEAYGYAAFLMAVKPEGTLKYGIDAYREPSPDHADPHLWIHPMYFYGIGNPRQSVSYNDIESYRLPGTTTLSREFDHAFVFLNFSEQEADLIDLESSERIGMTLIDPESGKKLSQLDIGPHTGIILKK